MAKPLCKRWALLFCMRRWNSLSARLKRWAYMIDQFDTKVTRKAIEDYKKGLENGKDKTQDTGGVEAGNC